MKESDYSEDYLLFGLLIRLGNQLQNIGDHFFEDITTKQLFMLVVLYALGTEHPPTLNEVALQMGSSHQNVKQLALKLEQTGMVKLKYDHMDRRKNRVHITQKSKELFSRYKEKYDLFVSKVFHEIDHQKLLDSIDVLTQIEAHLMELK